MEGACEAALLVLERGHLYLAYLQPIVPDCAGKRAGGRLLSGLVSTRIFGILWSIQVLVLLAASGSSLALSLTAFSTTSSVSVLGAITAISMGSAIYLAPVLGSLLDRLTRKQGIVLANASTSVVAALIALAVAQSWPIAAILGLVFLSSLAASALGISLQASVRVLRREADLTRVSGIVSLVENAPVVAGPIIGALIYALSSPALVFLIEAIVAAGAAVVVAFMRWPVQPATVPPHSRNPFAGMLDGLRFIARHRDLAITQGAFAGINVANGLAMPVVTAFVIGSAGIGATRLEESVRLGTINVAGALGLLLGSSLVVVIGGRVRRDLLVLAAISVGAVFGRVLLVLSPALWWLGISIVIRNLGVQTSNAPLTAIWQERTPVHMQGVVFGTRRLLGQGLYPVAVLVGAGIADALASGTLGPLGAMQAVILAAGVMELCVGVLLARSGALRRLAVAPQPPASSAS